MKRKLIYTKLTKEAKLIRGYVQHKKYHCTFCRKVLITNVYKASTPICTYLFILKKCTP